MARKRSLIFTKMATALLSLIGHVFYSNVLFSFYFHRPNYIKRLLEKFGCVLGPSSS